MMRVMILTADYPPRVWSGIGMAVERQALALTALGIEVVVLVAAKLATSTETNNGPSVRRLSRRRFPVDPQRFDLIHLHSLALSELALELRRRFGLPLIYTAHSLVHLELRDTPPATFWCAVQERLLATSDHVVFLSAAERSVAIHAMPELAARSTVIPNGVPAPPAPMVEPTAEGPIVFAGRFTKNKGVELLAELIPRVLAQRRSQFILAGGHGDETGYRAIRNAAAHFPDACRVVGWLPRDDLDKLFARAALVLIPSLYEPFGLVALEAMRMGAPVLAAGVGGLAEVVRWDSGGWVVPSHDPEEWRAAILDIISTPTIAQELRRRGPRYVAARFDIGRITERLITEVYAA